MQEGVAPDVFNSEHLKAIGFGGSNDRAVVPLLKDIGFLDSNGKPTDRYRAYRNAAQSRRVLAEALRESYSELFTLNEDPTKISREDLQGVFKQRQNSTDRVATLQAATFTALVGLADFSAKGDRPPVVKVDPDRVELPKDTAKPGISAELHYTVQIHLPATKDIDVYNSIFKSLRANLFDA